MNEKGRITGPVCRQRIRSHLYWIDPDPQIRLTQTDRIRPVPDPQHWFIF